MRPIDTEAAGILFVATIIGLIVAANIDGILTTFVAVEQGLLKFMGLK